MTWRRPPSYEAARRGRPRCPPRLAEPLPPAAEPRPGVLPPGAAKAAAARGRPSISDARSSRGRSRVLVLLLGLSTAWSALTLAMLLARGGTLGLLMVLVTVAGVGPVHGPASVSMVGMLLTVVTALAWFVWFDRVLRNVPPLTGQWPDSGRAAAIGWWLVPVVGPRQGAAHRGRRLRPPRGRGNARPVALGLWVITWIGGTVAPWIAERVLRSCPCRWICCWPSPTSSRSLEPG